MKSFIINNVIFTKLFQEVIVLRKEKDKLEKEMIRLRNLSTIDPVEIGYP